MINAKETTSTVKTPSVLREFFHYSSLNILGMLGLSCYILADTFFIANGVGADGLTALNLAIPVYSFIHGCALMLGMGGATRFSILKSQDQKAGCNTVFSCVLLLGLCFAAVFMLLGGFGADFLARLLGADSFTLTMTTTYLRMILLFSPAFLLNEILICFVRNDGKPRQSMLAMLGGSFSNIILDYVFIFPLNMGIFGAVLATCMAPVISLIILSPFFFKKQHHFHFIRTRLQPASVQKILGSGFPSLITELSSGIVIIVFNLIILHLEGNAGVAAYGVIANLSLVVLSIYTGIAQGSQPLISQYYGKGQHGEIRQVLQYAIVLSVCLSAVIYCVFYFQAEGITALFNSEKNARLQAIAVPGIRLYFSGCVFAGFNIILSVYFASISRALPANVISLLRGFLLILPVTFLLSAFGKMTGLWLAFPLTELLTALLTVHLLRKTVPQFRDRNERQ